MATLVLTAVGTAIAGPIGGAIGAIVGQAADAEIFASKARHGPRLGDLSIQTSSYGSQIPKIFGTMRVAGTVIWATDIKEDRTKSGGGKGQPKTVTYSYSASFAVALSGRPIRAVRRIWADGKLLRGAAGDFKSETGYRLYPGNESQAVDPLIASAEGAGKAPAHRGIAYAVFEDFQLADYGNRIPSLTFEVEADAGAVTIGAVAEELSGGEVRAGPTPAVTGYAASGDSVRGAIEALSDVVPLSLADTDAGLVLTGASGGTIIIEAEEADAIGAEGAGGPVEMSRRAAASVPAEASVSYYDVARDYQTGLQRAVRNGRAMRADRRSLAAALTAGAAKSFAEQRLASLWAARETGKVRLGWRRLDIRAGAYVSLRGYPGLWKAAKWCLERMVLELELVRVPSTASDFDGEASAGRPAQQPDLLHGPTKLFLLDLPVLGDEAPSAPLLFAAAAGLEPGWRRAALTTSLDGAGWEPQGPTAAPAIAGHAMAGLQPGGSALFDLCSSIEVELLNGGMWLEGRSDAALANGANAALLGDELIQFGSVEPMGNRRFRLSRLLRGRRGTEWAAAIHMAGEPFVLLERERLAPIEVPGGSIGGVLGLMAEGIGDASAPPIVIHRVEGHALQPPAPVHLQVRREPNGDVVISWVRRSRSGWAWLSGSDTPLGEETEAYRLVLASAGSQRVIDLAAPRYTYTAAQQAEDGSHGMIVARVSQAGTYLMSKAAEMSFG
jgi:hypothetical protein